MKKTIAFIFALGILNVGKAQQQTTAPANPPAQPGDQQGIKSKRATPEQMALRHSMHMQKMLGLTEDQKQKTYNAILTRTKALQTIRAKYGPDGDKKAMHAEAKPVRTQFVQTMNGILTPEQKTKWDEQRAKMKNAHNAQKGGQAPAGGATGKTQKLTDDDDGIDD